MALLGLLLILASGAVAVGVLLGSTNDTSTQVAWFDQTTRSLSVAGLFVLGAVCGILLMLGLSMLAGGMRRSRGRRVERKRAVREQEEQASALEQRNQELERKLAMTRAAAERREDLRANRTDTTTGNEYDAYPDEPATTSNDGLGDDLGMSEDDSVSTGRGRHRRS